MTTQPLMSNGTKTGLDATRNSTLSSLGVESRLGTNFTSEYEWTDPSCSVCEMLP